MVSLSLFSFENWTGVPILKIICSSPALLNDPTQHILSCFTCLLLLFFCVIHPFLWLSMCTACLNCYILKIMFGFFIVMNAFGFFFHLFFSFFLCQLWWTATSYTLGILFFEWKIIIKYQKFPFFKLLCN